MKILHLCFASFYYDGMEYQENLLPYFHSRAGHEVVIIADDYNLDENTKKRIKISAKEYVNEHNIPVIRLKTKSVLKIKKFDNLYAAIEKTNPDIIFIHGCQALGTRHILKYKKRNRYVKIFFDNHADEVNSIKSIKSKLVHKYIFSNFAKSLNKISEMNYGVTQGRCDFLKQYYKLPDEKIKLLIMGANDDYLKYEDREKIKQNIFDELNIDKDSFVFVTGGKFDKRKNLKTLLDAFYKLSGEINISIIIFGNIEIDVLKDIEKYTTIPNIHFVGWIPSSKAYDYFFAADAIVFPGTHSVLWEQSCAIGIPCVFKQWEKINHMNINGNCIMYDDIHDDLYDIIKKLATDKEFYLSIKVRSEKVRNKFLYSDIAKYSIGEK